MDTNLDGTTTLDTVTSLHNTSSTGVTMWGYDDTAAGETVDFECTSCHNPHGNSNYRILRPDPASAMDLTGGVDVSPIYEQWLWGEEISATDETPAAITIEDVDGYANGPNAVDFAFNDEASELTANFGDTDATVVFDAIEDSAQAPDGDVDVEIRLMASGATSATMDLQVYDGSSWTTLTTLTLSSYGTLTTISQSTSVFDNLTELNAAQVQLVGTGTGATEIITLTIDEVRLNVTYDDGYNPDVTDKIYTITYNTDNERIVTYSPKLINAWCAQCHVEYLAGEDAGHTANSNANFVYRHMTGAVSESGGTVITTEGFSQGCLKCHVAHGTSATMDNYSGSVPWPDDTTLVNGDARSSLLHIDNRGVCTQCHSSDNLSAN
jgi:hypothetical protein